MRSIIARNGRIQPITGDTRADEIIDPAAVTRVTAYASGLVITTAAILLFGLTMLYSATFQTDGTAGATLTGATSQTVDHGTDCSTVTANAPTGYHFVNWTGTGGFASTDNPVLVSNVTADMTVTANFAINQYTVTFQTDGTPGATLTGETNQTVQASSFALSCETLR